MIRPHNEQTTKMCVSFLSCCEEMILGENPQSTLKQRENIRGKYVRPIQRVRTRRQLPKTYASHSEPPINLVASWVNLILQFKLT